MVEGRIITFAFFKWWYLIMPQKLFVYCKKLFVFLYDFFSISVCLKTLFAVWKRDMIDYQGLSLSDIFQAWTLNLASRFIGFMVKILTIIVYLIVSVLFLLLAILFFGFWLLYPFVIAYLVTSGIKIIIGG